MFAIFKVKSESNMNLALSLKVVAFVAYLKHNSLEDSHYSMPAL